MATVKEDWVNIPQGRVFVKIWGAGDESSAEDVSIILLHDSLGCVELWRDFPERLALATGGRVIAYDRLGFGQSDPYPGALGLDFVSEEASGPFSAVCDHLGLGHFVAFGHSVGGSMAAVCAATYPARCCALVTESAQAFVEERTLEGIREAWQEFMQEGQLERLKKYHGDKAAWVLSAWVDTWLSDGFRHWNLDAYLPLVRCPVLVIHGEQDEYGSVLHPERIASLTAGRAVAEILPNCGHVPHREQEATVINTVKAFLARQA
ncbi:alpha/beta hydrolase [Aquisalimonas sp.]|uniref:alpha/beta fold hydrolase n=1 Tax=Aquisalimonas sp. TaxID=1872621 RepID=UPI0025C60770|nr:alpha/beta hydrolase [Aquisalimonas sp.]